MKTNLIRRNLFVLAVAVSATALAAPLATFSDSNMFPSRYTVVSQPQGDGGTQSVAFTAGHIFAQVSFSIVAGPYAGMHQGIMCKFASWDASRQGKIKTVAFRSNVKYNTALTGAGDIAHGLYLEQGGKYYRSYQAVHLNPNWQVVNLAVLVAANFEEVDGTGTPVPTSHPDFSAAGAPIRFGLYVATAGNAGTNDQTIEIKNWKIEINP